MDAELALGLGAALGLLVGAGAVLAFRVSERLQRGEPDPATARGGDDGESADLQPGVASILSVLPWSAVVLDTDDRVLRSSAAARARGLVEDDRVRAPGLLALAGLVRRDGGTRSEEVELPGGQLLDVHVAPLGGTGVTGTVLVLAEDLTEVRRVENVRRDFVANVSHELKTPVGALRLLADTVEEAADDPDAVRHFSGRMRVEAKRLADIVQEVVLLSRLQGSGPLAEPVQVDLGQVVTEAVDRNRMPAEAKGIDISVYGRERLQVRGDEELLVVALRNIIGNAVSYSPDGTRVTVRLRRDGGHAEVSVTDQGIGISPGDQQRVFERFFRVDPARSRATGGTGLGLAIVKHVMSNHGGDVRVWSKERLGSTFTVRLPLVAGVPSGRTPSGAPEDTATGNVGSVAVGDGRTEEDRTGRVAGTADGNGTVNRVVDGPAPLPVRSEGRR